VDESGKPALVYGEAAAVRQILGLVRDLGPEQFPGVPELYNPADRVAASITALGEFDDDIVVPRLVHELNEFFTGLGYPYIRAERLTPGGVEQIRIGSESADWEVRIPVRRDGSSLVLELTEPTEQRVTS
jgi:hypothetical protein